MPLFKTLENLVSRRFGKLIVIEITDPLIKKSGKKETKWLCKCDCGKLTKVIAYNLKNGTTKSCGCFGQESRGKASITHGLSKHPLYNVFSCMKKRCYNKNDPAYKDYGGRGIKICSSWLKSPEEFLQWGLSNSYKQSLQIDRRNNDGDYSPDNCHFVTLAVNMKNTRLIRSNNKSGYRGVSFMKNRGTWRAKAQNKTISEHKTPIEAAKSRDKYVIDNKLNLPLNFP